MWGRIAQAAADTTKLGVGIIGSIKAKKMREKLSKEQRGLSDMYGKKADEAWKDYETPDSLSQATNQAKMEAGGKSSIQSYMEENADIGLSRHLEGVRNYATSGATGLAAVQGAIQTSNAAKRDAAFAGQQATDKKKDKVTGLQLENASYEDKAWEMNNHEKYLQNLQFSQDYLSASHGNQSAAADTMAGIAG